MQSLHLAVIAAVFVLLGFANAGSNSNPLLKTFAIELADYESTSQSELDEHAQQLASSLDVDLVGQLETFKGVYLYRDRKALLSEEDSISADLFHRRHARRAVNLPRVNWAAAQVSRPRVKRGGDPLKGNAAKDFSINDPLFSQQWFLVDTAKNGDVNVTGVWRQGNKGANVHISLVDDGLDFNHPDFAHNYCADCSYDFNDNDPIPLPTNKREDIHGTRCAGQIAAEPNGVCGVGIAWEAKVGGIRILSGDVNDAIEARALSFRKDIVDIYSCSWGPFDNGATVEGPGQLLQRAFIEGVTNGRQGLGSIFVWASGNGGSSDSCNYDGYTNSPYTIAIGAVDRDGASPFYQESCAPQLAVTASSNSAEYITTTDIDNKCTQKHGGTSAAAPLAAGIFALALHENPKLTWRDMQWLVVETAVKNRPGDGGWFTNAAGYHHHHAFGFGSLDSYTLVERAKTWKTVGQYFIVPIAKQTVNQVIPFGSTGLSSSIDVKAEQAGEVTVLEYVGITVTVKHQNRGDLSFDLICPSGTPSQLSRPRRNDKSAAGLDGWSFGTVRCWGESPVGSWKLIVKDEFNEPKSGTLSSWSVTLYGTNAMPESASAVLAKKPVEPAVVSDDPFAREDSFKMRTVDVETTSNKNDPQTTSTVDEVPTASVFVLPSSVSVPTSILVALGTVLVAVAVLAVWIRCRPRRPSVKFEPVAQDEEIEIFPQ